MSRIDIICSVSLIGLLSHILLFIQGEWHLLAPRLFWSFVYSIIALFMLNLMCMKETPGTALLDTILPFSVYLLSLSSSIVVYRIFFHRLRQIPGPFWAKVSKFWHVFQCIDSKNHLLLDRLSKKYGPFVRTGARCFKAFKPGVQTLF